MNEKNFGPRASDCFPLSPLLAACLPPLGSCEWPDKRGEAIALILDGSRCRGCNEWLINWLELERHNVGFFVVVFVVSLSLQSHLFLS